MSKLPKAPHLTAVEAHLSREDSDPDILQSLSLPNSTLIPNHQRLSFDDIRAALSTRFLLLQVTAHNYKRRSPNPEEALAKLEFKGLAHAKLSTTVAQSRKEESDLDDISNNSSLTMDSNTPTSSPELDLLPLPLANDSLEAPTGVETLLSPQRPVPWPKNQQNPSNKASSSYVSTVAASCPSPPPFTPVVHFDDDFAPTPPISPREVEEEECEEVQSLRRSITASLALLRCPSSAKGILKPAPPLAPTPTASQLSYSSQVANASQSSQSDPASADSPSTETTDTPVLTKKTVRWCLSEEQEYRESQKPQLPASPKIHRGNRLILPDDSDDELMSVRSDDMPTPPLSPSAEIEPVVRKPVARNLFVRSSFPAPSIFTAPETYKYIASASTMDSEIASANSSSTQSLAPTSKPPPRLPTPPVPIAPKLGLTRSASTSTFLQRSSSQSFGSTNNLRTNTRANALIGTQSDKFATSSPTPLYNASSIPSIPSRTQSDAFVSLTKRSSKKRSRSPNVSVEEDNDAKDAHIPLTKIPRHL